MTEPDDTTDLRTDTPGAPAATAPPETAAADQPPDDPTAGGAAADSRRVLVRRLLNGLGVLLLLAVLAPFVVYAVPGVVGADASFVVLSGSMEPSISAGDVVVVESVPAAGVAVGDVITYSRSGAAATVTHRVVDIDGTGSERVFYTKGDANEDPDQRPVPASALVGTVVLTIPYIGYVIQFVGTSTGFALLVVLPFGALLVTEAVSLLRRRRAEQAGERVTSERSAPPADVAAAAPHTSPASGDEPVERDGGAAHASAHHSPTDETEGVAISSTDVQLTLVVLAVVLPYVVFVATELESPLSIGVAVGFSTGFVLLAGLFIAARLRERDGASDAPPPTTDRPPMSSDGGSVQEEER